MRNHIRILFSAITLAAATFGQTGQPPIIDRDLFFGDPEITGAQISPDGRYIAFLKPFNKTRNIWVKTAAEPFQAAKPITADTKRPIPGYFWSRDSKYILYVQDKDGDENYNVYAVNPADALPAAAAVPPARNITDAKGVRAALYAVPKSDPDLLYVGLNDRDKAWHDLYKVKISTGERTLLRKNADRVSQWVFDLKDQLRLAVRSAENGDTEILRVDPAGFNKIYSCGVLEGCGPVRFHKDGKRFYMETNKGPATDLVKLELMDAATGKEETVESDPQKRVDFGNAVFSEVSDELIATTYVDEKTRVYWKDKAFEADYQFLRKTLGDLEISFGSHTTDERLWLISAGSDTEPGATYLFDRKTHALTKQYTIRENIKREYLSTMEPIHYPSSDGLDIPAYLTLPKGLPAKNLPVLVFPHGGPWARDNWGYNPLAQFFSNRGYAVLSPNFRGSTGYGKKFLDAGNGEWGRKMQDDLTWGVKHLVAKGIANPKRVGIIGGSYGGYATLAGVAFTPDLYAAAVSIVGPSNLMTLLDSIPPYWEAIRKTFYTRMGDPKTPEGKAALDAESPLNSASKIKTPLMVVQGANDPRVNKAESDQIVIALRDRRFPVEYLVAPDEGHGFARPINNLALFAAAEKFFAKYLDGRSQESLPTEVATRLREITVDPATVKLAAKVDPTQVGAPRIAATLKPGTYKYKAKIALGERSMEMSSSTTIAEEGGKWKVTDSVTTAMGEATDTSVYAKDTLLAEKRIMKQGPMTLDVAYSENRVKGAMSMSGTNTPIDVDTGGPLFADASGAPQILASLPLADNYTVSFKNLDLQTQKVKLMTAKVTASEQVTVAAGKFTAYKMEISPADGGAGKTTVWVDKQSGQVVKVSSVLAQLGGATMTSELTPN